MTLSLGAVGCFHLLDFQKAQSFVLWEDLPSFVAIQVNWEAIGIEAKLFGDLRDKHQKAQLMVRGSKYTPSSINLSKSRARCDSANENCACAEGAAD